MRCVDDQRFDQAAGTARHEVIAQQPKAGLIVKELARDLLPTSRHAPSIDRSGASFARAEDLDLRSLRTIDHFHHLAGYARRLTAPGRAAALPRRSTDHLRETFAGRARVVLGGAQLGLRSRPH